MPKCTTKSSDSDNYVSGCLVGDWVIPRPSKISFQENLKFHLDRRGKRAADLARALGKTSGAVSKWINGKTDPPPFEALDAIAKFLDIPVRDLFNDPSDERTSVERPLYDALKEFLKRQGIKSG